MRKAFQCYTRPIQCTSPSTGYFSLPPRIFLGPTKQSPVGLCHPFKSPCSGGNVLLSRCYSCSPLRNAHNAASTANPQQNAAPRSRIEDKKTEPRAAAAKLRSPAAWAAQLIALLPTSFGPFKLTTDGDRSIQDLDLEKFASICLDAKKHAGVDILPWMVESGHAKAAARLMKSALKTMSGYKEDLLPKHPSNINWAGDLFDEIKRERPRPLSWTTDSAGYHHHISHASNFEAVFKGDGDPNSTAQSQDRVLNEIWLTLGRLVLNASNSAAEQAKDTMPTVLLVLGQIHNLGMMPNGIYDATPSFHSSYAQRPPILQLVSSRILTALSDAAWREQQDVAIAQATESGMSLKKLSESVPGGRFRLKVRPMGPEIWLELILWSCIEGGHIYAALRIIEGLRAQTDNPWFAIRWCSPQRTNSPSVAIDWERMKRRHGGTVGLIEGYSREKPLVDVPDRTISVEVVLALLEALLNSCDTSGKRRKTYRNLRVTRHDIRRIVTFLEPHDIPSDYFDYIESRLLQTGVFDMLNHPADLQLWSSDLDKIRNLEKAEPNNTTNPDLQVGSIVENTMLHSGIQQQALDGLIQFGDIHRSLAQFNTIQENVDQQKFKSITEYLQLQPSSETAFFSSRLFHHRLEYADSHGQMPYYKLAGFLNLISDTELTGLGQWLLYSDDLDGALIPESAYGLSCMATALCRFASVSRDENLLAKVVARVSSFDRKPSIRFLRRLFDADVQNLDFPNARNQLLRLRSAQGGGVGLTNIAHLASTIMRLEGAPAQSISGQVFKLSQATGLMREILRGDHDSKRGDYYRIQRTIFKQEIAHMLKVFYYIDSITLRSLAQQYAGEYRSGNLLSLPTNIFNILLSAIVSIHGPLVGKEALRQFCQDTLDKDDSVPLDISTAHTDSEGEVVDASIHTDATLGSDLRMNGPTTTWADENYHDAEWSETGSPQHYEAAGTSELDGSFYNPFFQSDFGEDEPHVSNARAKSAMDSHSSPIERDSSRSELTDYVEDDLLLAAQITIPNLQTYRIIVRATVEKKRVAQKSGDASDVRRMNHILKWSASQLTRFSGFSRNMIEQEIQQPVAELDEVVDDSITKPEASDSIIRFPPSDKRPVKRVPVSELWVPRKPRKYDTTVRSENEVPTKSPREVITYTW